MAVANRNTDPNVLLTTGKVSSEQVQVGDIEAGHFQEQTMTFRDLSRPGNILKDDVHVHTNAFIKYSRQYFPSKKLRTFMISNSKIFWWCMFMAVSIQAALVITASCLLEYTFTMSAVCLGLSAFSFIVGIPPVIVFSQHAYVMCCTLPKVLRQPVIKGMKDDNKHLEVAVTSLEGVYLKAHNRGIGLTSQTTGNVRFQVLSGNAVSTMKYAATCSAIYFVIEITLLIWAPILTTISLIWFLQLLPSHLERNESTYYVYSGDSF